MFAGGLCCFFSLICFWFLELSQQSEEELCLPFFNFFGGKGVVGGGVFLFI